jgi:hypothetical protein
VLRAGTAAIAEAKTQAGGATDREKEYIAALSVVYDDVERVSQRQRMLGYEKAMEALARKYPEDREAVVFHALAILDTVLPTDKSYAARLRAGAILEKEFKAQPDHPGIAHYIIHAYDVPPLAARALAAARRYATIAPASPHALHMPSHVFTRLGEWEASIESNIHSAAAARDERAPGEWLHALDYQIYAYLQTGQDRAATRIVSEIIAVPGSGGATDGHHDAANPFAVAVIPARYALERHAWAEAAALQPKRSELPYADAITHFARALGLARTGSPAAALKEVDALASIRDRLLKAKDTYWTEQVDIQRQVAAAWVALAEGRPSEAVELLRAAADREDATEKAATMPGPLMPARELLGDMLAALKQPARALTEYAAALNEDPNRFWSVYGAGRAAELLRDGGRARRYFQQLLKICARADRPPRAELRHAQTFVQPRQPKAN